MKYTLTVETDNADHVSELIKGGLRFEKKIDKAAELGDNRAAKANSKPKTPPPDPSPQQVSPTEEKPHEKNGQVTIGEIRAVGNEVCNKLGGEAQVTTMLSREFGTEKFSKVSPDRYADLLERLKQLGEEGVKEK